jgi:hypothetical protein
VLQRRIQSLDQVTRELKKAGYKALTLPIVERFEALLKKHRPDLFPPAEGRVGSSGPQGEKVVPFKRASGSGSGLMTMIPALLDRGSEDAWAPQKSGAALSRRAQSQNARNGLARSPAAEAAPKGIHAAKRLFPGTLREKGGARVIARIECAQRH